MSALRKVHRKRICAIAHRADEELVTREDVYLLSVDSERKTLSLSRVEASQRASAD